MGWPSRNHIDSGDKIYVEKDKIIKVHLLDDEPELYYTHYADGKTVKCTAPDCGHCTSGVKRNEKGHMRVRDTADNKDKVLAGTSALFQALHETVEMCGTRQGFVFAMKRTGEKTATRYHISALPLSAVSAPSVSNDDEAPF